MKAKLEIDENNSLFRHFGAFSTILLSFRFRSVVRSVKNYSNFKTLPYFPKSFTLPLPKSAHETKVFIFSYERTKQLGRSPFTVSQYLI